MDWIFFHLKNAFQFYWYIYMWDFPKEVLVEIFFFFYEILYQYLAWKLEKKSGAN